MLQFSKTHEINCTPDKFWQFFFDKPTTESLYLDALSALEVKVENQSELDNKFFQKLSVKPKITFPGPLAKLIGSEYSYNEQGTLDKTMNQFNWKWTPSVLSGKLRIEGIMRIFTIGENKIRLINEVRIEAEVFGVGSIMENSFEKQIRADIDTKVTYYNQLAAH